MNPDSPETRISRLETDVAGLKERVNTSAQYVARDISDLKQSLEGLRKLFEDQAKREDDRADRERMRDEAARNTRKMQVYQLIGTAVIVAGLLLSLVTALQGSGAGP